MKNNEQRIEELISRHLAQISEEQYSPMDELQWLHYKREKASKQLKRSRRQLKHTYNELTKPSPIPNDKWELLSFALEKAPILINGLHWGYRLGGAAKVIMSIRKMFKNKK